MCIRDSPPWACFLSSASRNLRFTSSATDGAAAWSSPGLPASLVIGALLTSCISGALCFQLCHGRTSHTTDLLTGTLALSGVPLTHAGRISSLVDVIHGYAE